MSGSKTLIIAEAGVNHNGKEELIYELIDKAAEAGADYVKFQTFKAENIVSKSARKADYQIKNIGGNDTSQFDMLKQLELKDEWYSSIIAHCERRKIKFLSTPFDYPSVDFLDKYIDLYKIPSGEITNLPYIERIASKNKPVIVSTGMANLNEIENCINALLNCGLQKDKISILHCNTEYPTPMKDVNLNAMLTIKSKFNVTVGYSDHTEGIEIPVAAVAIGAHIIEKHFTLDKSMPGPDHKASLDPVELKAMVSAIRNIEVAMGSDKKEPSASEVKNIPHMRKSLIALTDIKQGELFTIDNLGVKRPGNGISPMNWHDYLGKTSLSSYNEDELIKEQ